MLAERPEPDATAGAPALDADRALALARRTFEIEARALHALGQRLGTEFSDAVRMVLGCRGRVIVMGMGKSGHVGRKVAATLASTGTPAFFVHPAEAGHGDLGMVQPGDVVLAISNSGESDELAAILPALRRLGTTLVAVTGRPDSTLARHADRVLSSAVDQEACPLNLAPTASTTAALALGDALAVALLDARGFGADDFARSHPGGSLGRRLLTHVRDVMRPASAVPRVGPEVLLSEALIQVTRGGMGMTAITEDGDRVVGIFTDGDLRRTFERGLDVRAVPVAEVMTQAPRSIAADALAVEAATLMEERRISQLLVCDSDRRLEGAVTTLDLMRAKVI